MVEIIQIENIMMEELIRKLCYFGSSYLGNDLFYLKEFIDMMISICGEDNVIKMLKEDNSNNKKRLNEIGNDWINVIKKLRDFDRIINNAKGFYDKIEDKKFTDLNKKDTQSFLRYSRKVTLIKPDIYSLAYFFIQNTSIKSKPFKSEMWRILEHRNFRPVGELEQKRVGSSVPIYHE